jgi:hypothetical protein
MKSERKKIERELGIKEYYEHDNHVFFKTRSGFILFLSKDVYYQKLHRLQDYFKDREPNEARRLINENLAIGAESFPMKDYPVPKIEIFRDSCWATTIKVSGYAEGDPVWDNPDKDIMLKRSLQDARGNIMEESPWRTERNDWVWELAKKIRREIFGDD